MYRLLEWNRKTQMWEPTDKTFPWWENIRVVAAVRGPTAQIVYLP